MRLVEPLDIYDVVDDLVDVWHGDMGLSGELPDFLGMTEEEYSVWGSDGHAVPARLHESLRALWRKSLWARIGQRTTEEYMAMAYFTAYVVSLGQQDMEKVRKVIAIDDLVRMAREALPSASPEGV